MPPPTSAGVRPAAHAAPESSAAERALAGRARAAETKRTRSRERLLAAATTLFSERGWYRTRMEDIAGLAGLSVATAYNHFPTKYHLLGEVYAPLLHPVIAAAERDVAAGTPSEQALARSVHLLAEMARDNAAMTCAVLAALPEIYDRQGSATSLDDPRIRVEYERALVTLIEEGQRRGELRPHLPAMDVAMLVTGTLLVRVLTRPDESAQTTGDLLQQLLTRGLLV